MLDGSWTYIRFGYIRVNEQTGKAKGFVKFDELIRETNFPNTVIHNPLKNYLHICVGSAGKFYKNFNGQVTGYKLFLGKGSYLETVGNLNTFLEDVKVPELPNYSELIHIEESTTRYLREDEEVKPEEYDGNYHGCTDYAVGAWFRWLEIKRVPWEHLYTLTSNEKDTRQNAKIAGDRLLSLF